MLSPAGTRLDFLRGAERLPHTRPTTGPDHLTAWLRWSRLVALQHLSAFLLAAEAKPNTAKLVQNRPIHSAVDF